MSRSVERPRLRLAIIGLGRLGRACCAAIAGTEDLAVAGIVRRPDSLGRPLPVGLPAVPVAAHPSELERIDIALLCLPPGITTEAATMLLQHRIPLVEAASLSGRAAEIHRERVAAAARHHHVAAIMAAGWDPGVLGILGGLLAMVAPRGESTVRDRPGVSLHHTLAARSVPGVADALCTELGSGAALRRYVYVELEPGAALGTAEQAIRADPLLAGEETIVLPVESVSALEDEGQGTVIERWGAAAGVAHQGFLVEGRFDRHAVTAEIMIAAARALPALGPGACSLDEVPPALLRRGPPHA